MRTAEILGALSVILVFLKYIFQWISKVTKTLEIVQKIYHEFAPNGGNSLKDAINRIENRLLSAESRQMVQDKRIKALMQDANIGVVETDENGEFTWANRTFLKMVNKPIVEILSKGWVECLPENDREYIYTEWSSAVAQGREFHREYKLMINETETINVINQAWPLKDVNNKIVGYIGTFFLKHE